MHFFPISAHNRKMEEKTSNMVEIFGKRVQRCYGCFIPYHLRDMYLGEEVTFFCEHCKDDTMFHFNEFSKLLDLEKVREAEENHSH